MTRAEARMLKAALLVLSDPDRDKPFREAYRDKRCPERACDRCHELYRGPAVYCSLDCALADA